jgi:hypothetical protein
MQRARKISGLTQNRNQGGGSKKQGLPATTGVNLNAMLNIKKQASFCKCDVVINHCLLLPTNTPYQVCSPWPHFGGLDNTNARYTPLTSTQNGNTLLTLNATAPFFSIVSSPTLDSSDTIYVAVNEVNADNIGQEVQGFLCAYSKNGSLKWRLKLQTSDYVGECSPTVGKTGNIFIASGMGNVYCVQSDGLLLWSKNYTIIGIDSSILIGRDNNLYFVANNANSANVFCVKANNGDVVWKSITFNNAVVYDSVAIDSNLNTYFVYFQPNTLQSVFLVSLDCLGNVRNILNLNKTIANVSVGNLHCSRPTLSVDEQTVFVVTRMYIQSGGVGTYKFLHSIQCDTFQEAYPAVQFNVLSASGSDSLARDSNDRLFITVGDADGNGVLYGVKNGAVFLTYTVPKVAGSGNYTNAVGSPIVSVDGTVYFVVVFTTNGGNNQSSSVYAITSSGSLKWRKDLPDDSSVEFNSIETSLSINKSGNIIFSSNFTNLDETVLYSKLYSIF